MSISGNGASGKVGRLAATAEELESLVRDVAARGGTLRDVEQGAFDLVLRMGHRAVELFLSLQGNGDLGQTTSDADGRTLHRSDEPVVRPLRTIFGQHEFSAYVYRESVDTHAPIVFRPIDLRMGLAPGLCSLLLEGTGETAPIGGSILALSWAAREVEQRRRKNQPLVLLVDGQPSLWSDADACLGGLSDPDRVEVLDVVHVAGYVWKAAKVFHTHREHQDAFVRDRLLRILQGDVTGVITGLRRMATTRGLTGSARREITTVCGYFTTHAHRMRYDKYLKQGFPIATGVIEGACRHLVKDRMERSGMRWTRPQAQAMLDVRAMHQSSHWNEFHKHRATQHATPPHRYAKLLANLPPLAA